MGIQVVVKAGSSKSIEGVLGEIAAHSEVFPISDGHFGVSVPTKAVSSFGEQAVLRKLAMLEHFNLWSGAWHKPAPTPTPAPEPAQKPKWKFW
jgi:hypothetical protein